ncbi:MAG: radical SAM/SPASM domain-containing protein [Promethearchaeota archaeon]|jgi:MoaA/NifB/PqqE/SkfB family radical SAM enzyme
MTNTNEARIENCTACNYKCKFCPYSTSFTRKKEVMSLAIFKLIIDKLKKEAPQITDVTISGFGEAFLDKGLLEKIEYARKQNYNVYVLTNGSLLHPALIDKLFKLKIHSLRISLHTIKIKPYFHITGQYKTIVTNILDLIDYAIENRGKTEITITADVIDENRDDVKDLIEYFKDEPVILEIWEPHNWINWGNYREGKIVKKTCGRPFNGPLQIQVDGTINMCCFDYNGKLLLGNFLNQTLEEIFNSEPYLTIKKHHEEGTIEQSNLLCAKCDQLIDPGKDIVVYNNKFSKEERVGKTSTNFRSVL